MIAWALLCSGEPWLRESGHGQVEMRFFRVARLELKLGICVCAGASSEERQASRLLSSSQPEATASSAQEATAEVA